MGLFIGDYDQTIWLKIFARRGILKLDWVALTHLDEDHSGGLVNLSRWVHIDCVATSLPELESGRGKNLASLLASTGSSFEPWEKGCVPFPVLGPARKSYQKRAGNQWMSAMVIPLRRGGIYFSAGDASAEDELRFAKWAQAGLIAGCDIRVATTNVKHAKTTRIPARCPRASGRDKAGPEPSKERKEK